MRFVGIQLPTRGVCTLVVPEVQNSAFLLRIFEITGAEGGTRTPYFLALFLLGFTVIDETHSFFLGK
jgi:hypothetical protein